jgi:hypothetical protein
MKTRVTTVINKNHPDRDMWGIGQWFATDMGDVGMFAACDIMQVVAVSADGCRYGKPVRVSDYNSFDLSGFDFAGASIRRISRITITEEKE